MNKEEIIRRLSEMHLKHSTDPQVLCSAAPSDFDSNCQEAAESPLLQGDLFGICEQRNEEWTRIRPISF